MRKSRVASSRHRHFLIRWETPELACKINDLFDKEVFTVCAVELVGQTPGLLLSIPKACPVLAPLVRGDARLFCKARRAQRAPTILSCRLAYRVKDILLRSHEYWLAPLKSFLSGPPLQPQGRRATRLCPIRSSAL